MDIKLQVKQLVNKFGTRNPFEIAEKLNIYVQFADLGELSGFYTYAKRKRIILLNSDLQDNEYVKPLTVTMSHELGHAILHRDNKCYFFADTAFFSKSKIENEANMFAAELLIPDDTIISNPGISIEQFSKSLGYPPSLLNFKRCLNE